MSFGFANAFATFQFYVNKAFKSYFDIFCVVYLDDMLIYSKTKKKYWKHVRMILRALLKHRFYAKLSKCAFNRSEVIFLNFVIDRDDIKMEQSRIEAIADWSISKCAKNILVFLSFAEFYRRFVKGFSQVAAPLIDLIKDAKKGKAKQSFVWNLAAQRAFDELIRRFTTAFILQHFDWDAELRMKTDFFDCGAGEVLS